MKTLFLLSIFLLSAHNSSNTIESKNYNSPEKRIQILKKYFNLKSEIIDAVYEIDDANIDARSVPGATYRNYRIIIKIKKSDFSKWTDPECAPLLHPEYDWAVHLLKNNSTASFALSGKCEGYSTQNKEMFFFRQNGLILIRIVQA